VSNLVLADLEYSDELDAAALCAVLGGGRTSILKANKREKIVMKPNESNQTLAELGIVKITPPPALRLRKLKVTRNII